MKNLGLLIIIMLLNFSCDKNIQLPYSQINIELNKEFTIGINNIVVFQNDTANFSFELISVENSLCPCDVVCIWEGSFIAEFKCINCENSTFKLGNGTNALNDLSLNPPFAIVKGYKIKLLEVTPCSTSTYHPELSDYLLKLVVTENYNLQKQYKKALEYYQLKTNLKDSIDNIDKSWHLEEIKTTYEVNTKEQ